jgi:predicted nucleotidyltransferase
LIPPTPLKKGGFKEFCKKSIGVSIQELLKQQRSQIIALAEKHGASNVRVFGSVARGEATEDSDIDFLVDYDLEKITPWFPGGLLLDLEQLLNRQVDIVTVDMLKERIRDRILLEAVKL